jgi:hypothetical protein
MFAVSHEIGRVMKLGLMKTVNVTKQMGIVKMINVRE